MIDKLKAISQGIKNFNFPKLKVERLAKKRLEKMKGCKHFVDEPIISEIVVDKRIPELTGKICNKCMCVGSYKVRQSIIKCKCWEEAE